MTADARAAVVARVRASRADFDRVLGYLAAVDAAFAVGVPVEARRARGALAALLAIVDADG